MPGMCKADEGLPAGRVIDLKLAWRFRALVVGLGFGV